MNRTHQNSFKTQIMVKRVWQATLPAPGPGAGRSVAARRPSSCAICRRPPSSVVGRHRWPAVVGRRHPPGLVRSSIPLDLLLPTVFDRFWLFLPQPIVHSRGLDSHIDNQRMTKCESGRNATLITSWCQLQGRSGPKQLLLHWHTGSRQWHVT